MAEKKTTTRKSAATNAAPIKKAASSRTTAAKKAAAPAKKAAASPPAAPVKKAASKKATAPARVLTGVVVERKEASVDWHDVNGAQDAMDRALPLALVARDNYTGMARSMAPLAEVAFDAALLFTNSDGMPDIRRDSFAARQWTADLLDGVGLKVEDSDDLDEKVRKESVRKKLSQALREAMSPVRVLRIRALDDDPEQMAELFPGFSAAADIFKHYDILPKTQAEIRAENYQRRALLQQAGAAALEEGESTAKTISPERSAEVVRRVRKSVAALVPSSFGAVTHDEAVELRKEIKEARAALLKIEKALPQ
ncbi:hypothetical protein [Kitasatospora sp. McL0602]|uniref:hypothetical protein n=1 Tax=Kitasatospora sp. McL0602 TaxID=3439530 RepID=UPI003F8A2682